MYYVYILENLSGKHYVGSTSDVEKRLKRHNAGGSVWTKKYRPWNLIYIEEFKTKIETLKREKEIKSFKGGSRLRNLLK